MATSAFKSTSRKPNSRTTPTAPKKTSTVVQPRNQQNPTRKPGPRRSRSVSAFSRTHLDITSDFNNTRVNPLFWADGSDSPDQFDDVSSKFADFSDLKGGVNGGDSRRGRPVSRNSCGGGGGGGGRSLSTVDTGRRQRRQSSPSPGPHCGNYERSHCNDGMPKTAISEPEERTIKPVSEEIKVIHWEDNNTSGAILETVRTEVRRAISDMHKDLKDVMRSDSEIISGNMVSDGASGLQDPNAEELVTDFREEFSRELEECEERTRKLRAELAVEEYRELELNQILCDMIPEPETPQVQKPRLIRKASSERKKMSKCLEEEAMAYFDECVSISTFNDSDFSSLEDPPSHVVGEITDVPCVSNRDSVAWSLDSQDLRQQSQHKYSYEESTLSTSGVSRSSPISLGRRPQFSFTSKPSNPTLHEQGIRNYAKMFSKDKARETSKSHIVRAVPQESENYDSNMPVEKYLLDRMAFKNRIESGGMLLCGGGVGFLGLPSLTVFGK